MEYRQPFEGSYPITQRFGETITDQNGHTGIDYGCPIGTPILASESGTVTKAGWDPSGYGYCVFIKHPDGNTSIYAHMAAPLPVHVGEKVKRSQVIGYSASTGNSTGPHLHFEVRGPNNKAFDPMTILHSSIEKPENPPEEKLKGASSLGPDVQVVAPAGAWGWNIDFTRRDTVFPDGTKLHYTGRTMQRLGYTYCECFPDPVKYWVAVNDGVTQILDNMDE